MHLAAESHVDRSIDGPAEFIQTNIIGTYTLLEKALAFWRTLPSAGARIFAFSMSRPTRSLAPSAPAGSFTRTLYRPRSPYSASKAASDHLVRSWHHTYGLPVVISNCSNNYGPYHFPEKLIPLTIINALKESQCLYTGTATMCGTGFTSRITPGHLSMSQVGERARLIARRQSERSNLEVVKAICSSGRAGSRCQDRVSTDYLCRRSARP